MKIHLLLCLAASIFPASASVLMLDFGPITATGTSLTNSPYHASDPAFTGDSWNKIGLADATGLNYADGTAATGVGVDLGSTTTTTIDLSVQPTAWSNLGGEAKTGVYLDTTSVGRDGIFSTGGGSVGAQITGLAAGIYEVYVLARNTSSSAANTVAVYAGTGAAGSDFDYSSYGSSSISYSGGHNQHVDAWVEAGGAEANYHLFTITLAEGEALNIAADPLTVAENRGFLNAIQIVQVPELSAAALFAFAFVPLALRRRRFV